MKTCRQRTTLSFLAAATLALGTLAGCGSDSSSAPATAPPAGAVVQGPVQYSFVFADSLTTGTRYVKDPEEVSTFTDDKGKFAFPTTPAYSYVVVSQNGTDSLTGRKAIQLLAPAGARNLSALTTLVALAPTTEQTALKAKLEGLGVKYDDDISQNVTTAALLVIKSVENTIDALSNALNSGAKPLPISVISDIQAKAATAIASSMANAGVITSDLINPAALKSTIGPAVATALGQIEANYRTIIDLGNGADLADPAALAALATNLADATVTAVVNAVGPVSTTTGTTEAAIITTTVATTLSTAVDTTITAAESAVSITTDTTAPTVSLTNFASGATNVVLDTIIQAKFSEALNPATVTATTVTLKAGTTTVAGTVSYNQDTRVVTFTPSAPLAGSTVFTFTLTSGIKDVSDNALAATTITFTTIAATSGGTGSTGSTGSSGNTL